MNQSPRRESRSPWTPRTNFSEDIRIVPCDASCDGHGLKLRLNPSGARRWLQRLVIHGKPRTLGLGGYLLVSLAEAREKAFANHADHAGGPVWRARSPAGTPRPADVMLAGKKDPRWLSVETGRAVRNAGPADCLSAVTPQSKCGGTSCTDLIRFGSGSDPL